MQTCKTDEEIEEAVVLGNDGAQEPGNLEKPNFAVPAGKKFGGWSTEPNSSIATHKVEDALNIFTENTTLYPVWLRDETSILPENPYGVDYKALDAVATLSEEGKYNATVLTRAIVNASTIKDCYGGAFEWSWDKDKLPTPTMSAVPDKVLGSWVNNGTPYVAEGDAENFLTYRRGVLFYRELPHGPLIPGEQGTGYKEVQLHFTGFEAVPGETLEDVVRFRDFQRVAGTSSVTWTPMNLDDGEEIPGIREEVIPGSIRIPGRTITYKESNAGDAAVYIQTCKTDEEIEGTVVLGNDANQDSGNLDKPNFVAPAGKKFAGWSTEANAETAEHQPEEAFSVFNENTTLYPVWVTKVVYNITYDGNGGDVDKDIDTIPEGESLSEFPNAAREGYVFAGWFTENGEEIVLPYSPVSDITLYAHWNMLTAACPLTLDLSNYTLKDINGDAIEGNNENGAFTFDKQAAIISIDSRVFENICPVLGEHTHELHVTGSNSKVYLNFKNQGNNNTPFHITVDTVSARGMEVRNMKQLSFKGKNQFGGKLADMNITLSGISLSDEVQQISFVSGAEVTAYNDGGNDVNSAPIALNGNSDVKLLDLLMNEVATEDTIVKIMEADRILPTGMNRIAVIDSADGLWLKGDIEVKSSDGTQKYVRGVAENSDDTTYLDNHFSDNNIYGNTFALSGVEGQAEKVGRYQAVHLPVKLKQLKITVPTSIVFNIYTNGIDNTNGDYGFIAPQYELKNNSIIYADSFIYANGGSNVIRNIGRTDASVKVGYAGVKEDIAHNSMYTLKSYEEVTEEEMSQAVGEPLVCLEIEANHDNQKRISISEESAFSTTPTEWFTAEHGISNIQLKVPKAYTDGNSKRYYQIPKDIKEDDNENTVLRGFHTMKLGFALN